MWRAILLIFIALCVVSRKNIDPLSRNYDPDLNQWVYRTQAGLTPILSFQIDL